MLGDEFTDLFRPVRRGKSRRLEKAPKHGSERADDFAGICIGDSHGTINYTSAVAFYNMICYNVVTLYALMR